MTVAGTETDTGVYVALLRGINVGGRNSLPMKLLAEMYREAGCISVQTYIQSGNVVFRAPAAQIAAITAQVEAAILAQCGISSPITTRSATQLRAIAVANPYLPGNEDLTTLHVGFLAARPSAAQIATLDPQRSPPDAFTVQDTEIYFHFPRGVGPTKLTNVYFDGKLKTTLTLRNWRTTLKLCEMAEAE